MSFRAAARRRAFPFGQERPRQKGVSFRAGTARRRAVSSSYGTARNGVTLMNDALQNDVQQKRETPAGLWEEIAECILSMEALSLEMITCPEAVLLQKAARREALMERIRALHTACEGCVPPEDEAEAARVLAARETARAAACRMQELDRQAAARIKREQERILEKLRSVGKSAGAHASRYYQAHSSAPRSTFLGSV